MPAFLMLFVIWGATQFSGMFYPPLLDDADSVHVEAAREMLLRGDYVTLHADGVRYFDKPPLPYWLAAGSMRLFGVHDWAARLPLALAVLALMLHVYVFGTRMWGERGGFYAALILGTSIGPYFFTRFFIPDIMVALWISISVDLMLRILDGRDGKPAPVWQCWGLGLVAAANVLTKGLIGIVFPVGILLTYVALTGQWRRLGRFRLVSSAMIFLAAAVPWHWLAAVRNPPVGEAKGWFWFYFINDQINRYLNTRIPHDYDKVPLVTFWALLVVWLLPWGLFLPGAIRSGFFGGRKATSEQVPEQDGAAERRRALLMCLVWALFILVFFSFSSRQEYYTIPAVPALALITGAFLARAEGTGAGQWEGRFVRISGDVLTGLGCLIAVVCVYFAVQGKAQAEGADLYALLHQHVEDYTLSFGHFFDLTPAALGMFRGPLWGTAVFVFAGTLLASVLRHRRRVYAANVVLAAAMAGFLVCAQQGMAIFYPILGSEPIARAIERTGTAADTIVIDGEYTDASSVNFYTGREVHMLNGRRNGLWYGSLWPDCPKVFEDDASFSKLWSGPGQVFLITTREDRLESLKRQGPVAVVMRYGGKLLLSNRAGSGEGGEAASPGRNGAEEVAGS